MFILSNLRKEKKDEWTRVVVDFKVTNGNRPFGYQDTLWFAVKNKNADLLADDVYDAFAPFVLFLGMHYHHDVRIEGKMSPLLYHNLIHDVTSIFDNFSTQNKRVKFSVDGLKIPKKGKTNLIGAGFSCGVDSLNTLYTNFVEVEDESLKINCLLNFNCGQHGKFGEDKTIELWKNRVELHREAREELGLPIILIDSNLHSFYTYTDELPFEQIEVLGVIGCILSVQRGVRRYIMANCMTYDEVLTFGITNKNLYLNSYTDPLLLQLFSTEIIQIVIDGCEFTRAEKLERIKDWKIAREHLDVCIDIEGDGRNCSLCPKCMRTLLLLDSMNELDKFKKVFDLETFRKGRRVGILELVLAGRGLDGVVFEYMKKQGVYIPPKLIAVPEYFLFRVKRKLGRIMRDDNGK